MYRLYMAVRWMGTGNLLPHKKGQPRFKIQYPKKNQYQHFRTRSKIISRLKISFHAYYFPLTGYFFRGKKL